MLFFCVKSFYKKRSEIVPNDLIYITTRVYNSPTPRLPYFHYLLKMKLKLGKLVPANENDLILLVVGLLNTFRLLMLYNWQYYGGMIKKVIQLFFLVRLLFI